MNGNEDSHNTGGQSVGSGVGLVVIHRLHRLVRHGWRPWLGYDVASRQDSDIHLRRKGGVATLYPDGMVVFSGTVDLAVSAADKNDALRRHAFEVAGDDETSFDALFPPNTPNKRNIMRRLYEIGF